MTKMAIIPIYMVKTPTTLSSDCTCWLSGERSLPLGYLLEYYQFQDLTKSQRLVLRLCGCPFPLIPQNHFLSVAKRKSLFDDKPVEIQELTYIIKEDINSLNKQIAQLQEVAKIHSGQNGRQKQSHSNSVVVALQVWNNLSSLMRKPAMWLQNRSDTNQAAQAQKMARGLKLKI